jgi:hypothetical protein
MSDWATLAAPAGFGWTAVLREERRRLGAPTISAVVHTRNEERVVDVAIRSLGWVDEVVVVDMESEDETVGIARGLGARVVSHPNVGFVEPARNFGFAQATSDWVLVVDADEAVPERLARRLTELTLADDVDVVAIPFAVFLLGRRLEATGTSGHRIVRFFRRGHVDWPAQIHGKPVYRGRQLALPVDGGAEMLHWNHETVAEHVARTNVYTDREAEVAGDLSWDAAAAAVRAEFVRRWTPEVDGTRSVALTMAMAFYRFLTHAKRWERAGWPDIGAPADAVTALCNLFDAPDGTTGSHPAQPQPETLHAQALEAWRRGDTAAAFELLRSAVASSIDLELLNDFAVVAVEALGPSVACDILRAALAIDPERSDAKGNLDILDARSRQPAAL